MRRPELLRPDVRRRVPATVPTPITGRSWRPPSAHQRRGMRPEATLDMGWGRLVFGQTFPRLSGIVDALRAEGEGHRDVCIYPPDPQVLVGLAPDELFIDPSYVLRLDLYRYRPRRELVPDVFVRTLTCPRDVAAIRRLHTAAGMVAGDAASTWRHHAGRTVTHLVAEDRRTGAVVGAVTGVDHVHAFGCPERGASLWCLAVDERSAPPGTAEALVRVLAERYLARGRAYLDLSVLHDDARALALHRRLGFRPLPAVCVKRKNPVNAPLFAAAPPGLDDLPVHARVVADEALRRGIRVEVTDADSGELRLSLGGRSVLTRESLSELTSAVALSRCGDRRVTRRVVQRAGVRVARGAEVVDGDAEAAAALLREVGEVVVRPARGDRGSGSTVGVRDRPGLHRAVALALRHCPDVLVEEQVAGCDLRVVVIDHRVVAAAVRRPAGGAPTDVTDRLHPALADAAVRASRAIGTPVVGLDFAVPDLGGPEHVLVAADARPGLADHAPRPTAECFVDLLFPGTRRR